MRVVIRTMYQSSSIVHSAVCKTSARAPFKQCWCLGYVAPHLPYPRTGRGNTRTQPKIGGAASRRSAVGEAKAKRTTSGRRRAGGGALFLARLRRQRAVSPTPEGESGQGRRRTGMHPGMASNGVNESADDAALEQMETDMTPEPNG